MPVELTCARCGKLFTATQSQVRNGRRFCSFDCFNHHRKGDKHAQWKGGLQTVKCAYCGKELKRTAASLRRVKFSYCDLQCRSNGVRLGISKRMPTPAAERFWPKVDVRSDAECWVWRAARDSDGYGHFHDGTKMTTAHRFAWSLLNGDIPAGMSVMHSCDNPPCCNPAHLSIGTNVENTRDREAKGRHGTGSTGKRRAPELVWNASLTQTQADEIRIRYARGDVQQKELAREFGVTPTTVWRIISGKSYHSADDSGAQAAIDALTHYLEEAPA